MDRHVEEYEEDGEEKSQAQVEPKVELWFWK
jgi:hypothetical protein